MDKSLKDIVKERMDKEGLSVRDLSRITGIKADKIYKWYDRNRVANPKAADALVLQNWLDGKLPKLGLVLNDPPREDLGPTYLKQRWLGKVSDEPYFVPLIPVKARAGYAHSYDNVDFVESLETYQMPPGIPHRGAEWRWVEVGGDSMEKVFYDGDILLCSVVPHADWKDLPPFYIYTIIWENDFTVKRVVYDKGDFVLFSENLDSEPAQVRVPITSVKEVMKVRRQINARFPISQKFKIKV